MRRDKCMAIILAGTIVLSSVTPVSNVYAASNRLQDFVQANIVERILLEDDFESYDTEESFDEVWEYNGIKCKNHYISGAAPYDFERYTAWLREADLI